MLAHKGEKVQWIGWLVCVQLIVCSLLAVAVGGICSRNCQVVGSLISFVDVLDFFGVLILVCD